MSLKDIPVIGVSPGSQPAEEDGVQLEYIEMPREMSAYRKPVLPDGNTLREMDQARDVMRWLQNALVQWQPDHEPWVVDISHLNPANRDLVNQILGEGEVSVKYDGPLVARMQESVLAGVWRTLHLDAAGRPVRDLIEVGEVPALAYLTGRGDARRVTRLIPEQAPADIMNALPIMAELEDHVAAYRPGDPAHVINLTLLPLMEQDVGFLDESLGKGPVSILSRGYGDCTILSTGVPDIWWVRYFNSTGKLILNTLEVVDLPLVARAAMEDIRDSGRRLRDILEPYEDIL